MPVRLAVRSVGRSNNPVPEELAIAPIPGSVNDQELKSEPTSEQLSQSVMMIPVTVSDAEMAKFTL
jgi:hypothetical protein